MRSKTVSLLLAAALIIAIGIIVALLMLRPVVPDLPNPATTTAVYGHILGTLQADGTARAGG